MAEIDVVPRPAGVSATRPVGASAVVRERLDTLVALATADLRVRYGRGRYRFLKWLLDPFALLGVYLVLVTFVLDKPGVAPGLSLACAIVPFQLVMATVVSSTMAINSRGSIILNMRFDRSLIPAATVATETFAFLASLSMIALTMAYYGVVPTAALLWTPVLILVTAALALGVAYPTSLVGLWFPELRVFVVSFARALFFLAPGLVPLSEASENARRLLQLNPLTGLFNSYRSVFVDGASPAAYDLVYPLVVGALLLGLFVPLFRSEQRQFAKVVE